MSPAPRILAIDAGTSGVRAVVVDARGALLAERRSGFATWSPSPGHVEFDAAEVARAALAAACGALADAGPVAAVGVANQRASTVLWERASGAPVAPALGWQDLRTRERCAELARAGLVLLPNQSASKLAHLLDAVDPARRRDLCFGTVDAWLAFVLSEGKLHVSDASNASATGLFSAGTWSGEVCDALRVPEAALPRLVDSSGVLGPASALPGAPALAGLLGDQQAALLGQGCVQEGSAKLTAGSGAMLDVVVGETPPPRGRQGTFPIVAWRLHGRDHFALEAIALAAGSHVEWLCDALGVLASPSEADAVAGSVPDTGGVVFVPAFQGLGTPHWDLSARGAFFGLTRGTGRGAMVRAVLEGVGRRCADLLAAAEADAGHAIPRLRVDGGLAGSAVFLRTLADASGRPVEVAPVRETSALGAAFAAGLAVGAFEDLAAVAGLWRPRHTVEPGAPPDPGPWREALARASRWAEGA